MLYPVVDVGIEYPTHQIGLGMDVGLFPSRKAAFEQARDEQRVIATAPAGLFSPVDTPGYVLFRRKLLADKERAAALSRGAPVRQSTGRGASRSPRSGGPTATAGGECRRRRAKRGVHGGEDEELCRLGDRFDKAGHAWGGRGPWEEAEQDGQRLLERDRQRRRFLRAHQSVHAGSPTVEPRDSAVNSCRNAVGLFSKVGSLTTADAPWGNPPRTGKRGRKQGRQQADQILDLGSTYVPCRDGFPP